jgi:hypothetical protein
MKGGERRYFPSSAMNQKKMFAEDNATGLTRGLCIDGEWERAFEVEITLERVANRNPRCRATIPGLHVSSTIPSHDRQELLPLILTADFSANDLDIFNTSTTIRTNIRAMYFA